MKLHKIFYTLCVLCVLYTSRAIPEETIKLKIRPALHLGSSSENFQTSDVLDTDNLRDKRALGVILSGLAQVFGYNLNPIQITSLPNTNSDVSVNGGSTASTNLQQPPPSPRAPSSTTPSSSTSSVSSTTTLAPRQRETIRFTGVVNFGNNTDVLSHLQQYERIFHGESTTQASTTTTAPSTSSSAPLLSLDARTSLDNKPPLLSPLLVKIPLPIVSDLPAPLVTSEDLKLSYPEPYVPVRKEQESVYRKNENSEKFSVANKDIYDAKDVMTPPSKDVQDRYVIESHWKKEYEDRLAELERKQEQHEQKLRQQELKRSREKDEDRDEERYKEKYKNEGKQTSEREKEEDSRYKENSNGNFKHYSSEEDEDTGEAYEGGDKSREYSSDKFTKSREKDKESTEKYRDYEKDNSYKSYKQYDDSPVFSNYSSLQYNQQLPISDYYEQRKPEGLRNSYGEILDDRGLIDEGIVSYFDKFKRPQNGLYSSTRIHNLKDVSGEEQSSPETSREDSADIGRLKEEYFPTARSKYEEYDLDKEKNVEREREGNSKLSGGSNAETEISKKPYQLPYFPKQEYIHNLTTKYNNQINSNEDRSNSEEDTQNQEFDFAKYTPYIVPVRYLYAPDELKKATERVSTAENLNKDTNIGDKEIIKQVTPKSSRKFKEEDLKPKIGLPERLSPRKLHEGESKELRIWPAPFDYEFDSTEQADVKLQRYTNNKIPNVYQKTELPRKGKEISSQEQEKYVITDNSQKYGRPENAYRFQEGVELHRTPSKQSQGAVHRKVNTVALNYTRPSIDTEEVIAQTARYQEKKQPDITENYKYVPDDYYGSNEQPNVERFSVIRSKPRNPLYSPKVESLKQDNRRIEPPVGHYYRRINPNENGKIKIERVNPENSKVSPQKSVPIELFNSPKTAHDFFGFSQDDYNFDEEGKNKESFSNVETDKKSTAEEEAIDVIAPEPDPYHYDESLTKFTNEPETEDGRVKVSEYRNKVETVRVSKQKQIHPNVPISYISYTPHS